jgi:hypothetical protein
MPGLNAPAGLLKAAMQAPELMKAAQALPELAGLLGATVWHGSPYAFKRFDPTKIGSGEGAQAYGYGHYLAEAPGVAKEYRDKLSNNIIRNRHIGILKSDSDLYEALRAAVLDARAAGNNQVSSRLENVASNSLDSSSGLDAIRNFWANQAPKSASGKADKQAYLDTLEFIEKRPELVSMLNKYKSTDPSLYKIDLPDEQIAKMLDWDKPLNKQSQEIQNLAKQYGLTDVDHMGGDLVAAMNAKRPAGAELMRQAGIPGIRYLDQGSRGSGQGTSNFVIFPGNEGLLKILERNNKSLLD